MLRCSNVTIENLTVDVENAQVDRLQSSTPVPWALRVVRSRDVAAGKVTQVS